MNYEDLSKKIHSDLAKDLSSAGSVAVKTNFLSNGEYPISTSWVLFKNIIRGLRTSYNKGIILIEPEFSDIRWSDVIGGEIDFLRDNNIKLVQANKEKRVSAGSLYIPKSWQKADIRISIANVTVHRHHSKITFFGGAYNVSWLFSKTDNDLSHLKKDMYASGMDLDYAHFISEVISVSNAIPTYSIVDAGKVAFSDEHEASPKIVGDSEYFSSSFSLKDADMDIVKRLEINVFGHHHHEHHHEHYHE